MKDVKKEIFNPYLPSWEYIPDGEPHVFGDRIYIYGSHDFFNGHVFCLGDYVCYSASVDDLTNFRYEGVIYPKTKDPLNKEGKMCLYAPDVTMGSDGRYYLYYVLDHVSVVSVAVCDTPAGEYEFYGYVQYEDGVLLGDKETDEPQFDPAVITMGEVTYLYTGFCGPNDRSRSGSMVTVLGPDMLTIKQEPQFIVPSAVYAQGTSFEGHAFFEAPSIRKVGDLYYFVYSSQVMHELCYATSPYPDREFTYGGVIVSNSDLHIDTYKAADMPTAYGANNHGGIEKIGSDYYIFYHRHTNGNWYSRQGCAEKITILEDGSIPQVEITSSGINNGPLLGNKEFPAYIACHLFTDQPSIYVGSENCPRITQDGADGDENPGYIANMKKSATAGFKYFECKGVKKMAIRVRGYADGKFEIRTQMQQDALATIKVKNSNVWERYETDFVLDDGIYSIYITYVGNGTASLGSFEFICEEN